MQQAANLKVIYRCWRWGEVWEVVLHGADIEAIIAHGFDGSNGGTRAGGSRDAGDFLFKGGGADRPRVFNRLRAFCGVKYQMHVAIFQCVHNMGSAFEDFVNVRDIEPF